MKKTLTILLLSISTCAFAQDSLKNFNYNRYRTTTTGMEVLGSWGVANIAAGAVGWSNSKGGQNKYFYQMTTIWGAANLGAAILGYTGAQKNKDSATNGDESIAAQKRIENTFLINGDLDIIYIGVGAYLKQRGEHRNNAELKGYGSSVITQGAFLLLFDGTMYFTHLSNGNKLRRFLQKNPLIFNGRSVGMIYHL